MDMTGEYQIDAPRQRVWDGLNDPETLKACIPGCDEIIQKSDTELSAKVTAKVGPVKAKFSGDVTLSDVNPPESYTISGEGKGGPAGFAKGGAKVRLTELSPTSTQLNYEVDAQVGGKLAQIGARLINGTAKKMADDFFGKFAEIVATPAETAEAAPAEAAPAPVEAAPAEEVEAPAAAVADTVEEAAAPVVETAKPAAATSFEKSQQAVDKLEEAIQGKGGGGGVSPVIWVLGIVTVILILVSVFS